MTAFLLGLYVAHARVWPFPILREISRFVEGHRDEATSLFEKLVNDAGVRPERFLYEYTSAESNGFRPVTGLALAERRDAPLVKASGAAPGGYLFIVGKFDFADGMNGVLLFDTAGNLIKHWVIPDREIKDGHHHLFHMLRDGSIISAADFAGIYHMDRCGTEIGRIDGNFHHSIAPLEGTKFWVTGSVEERDAISLIDIADYSVERTILLDDIHKAVDPELAIFQNRSGSEDPWHNNDVEPLSAEMAVHHRFDAGDLLISYRHSNLIYIVDPDTLKTKWWSNDYLSGPHDPDWQADGTLTVYDNRALGKPGKFSTIQRYDFSGAKPAFALDGRDYDFYSGIGGKHTIFGDGSILTLAYEQGRVLWVGPDKEVLFEFANRYSEDESLVILNAGYLPSDYFNVDVSASCS